MGERDRQIDKQVQIQTKNSRKRERLREKEMSFEWFVKYKVHIKPSWRV